MPFGSRQNSVYPVGIDFGAHSIKMVQLERLDDSWRVVDAARRRLPDDLPAEGDERSQALATLLGQMVEKGKFVGRKVVTTLPATTIQYKNLRMPAMPGDELKGAVQWEAADRLHLDVDSFQIEFFDAGEVRQGEEVRKEIIVLAAPKRMIQDHLVMLKASGLQPVAIDAVPGALARIAHVQGFGGSDDEARVLIDLGASSTKVVICRGGGVVFFKLIDIGGQRFDQVVAKQLKLSPAAAAEARRGGAQDGVDPEETGRAVADALRETIQELAREISLCLRYYSVTFRGSRPDTVTLVGGEASHPHLADLLGEAAGFNVDRTPPFEKIKLTNFEALGGSESSPHCWHVGLGLALRGETRALRRRAA